ncbi:acetyltransferase [Vibrio cholerae]|nr:acetyltransferase [Vibrio cholerae]
MVTVGVFEFCGMRCQPLRRALWGFIQVQNSKEVASEITRN